MIEISGLTKVYRARGRSTTVLDGIDLTVNDAQIAAVVGPSGAGKTTLARCVNLLQRPTSGSIVVNGQDLTSLSRRDLRQARRQIGTVFQSANLLSRLTAAENVALPMRYAGLGDQEIRARVTELLERVGMLHRANHYPAQLSGGQQQRIGIARGLALRPTVLLSDEATSGLDPDATRAILGLLAELRDDLGVTILVITHEMDVVRAIADTVAQLDQGRIVEQGPVADVVRGSDSALSQALLPLPPVIHDGSGAQSWILRYSGDRIDPRWITQVSRELEADIAVRAALIEETSGASVGRLVVDVDRALAPEVVRRAFLRHDITAALADAEHSDVEEAIA